MFFSQLVLAKKGPLGKIWLAAHMEKKVPKLQIIQTNIPESVENIENPTVPMALRVSGHLLLGVVRIFSRKVTYLLTDCSEALVKIKDAFRVSGGVELAPGAGTKSYNEITNADQLNDDMDLDADLTSQAMLFSAEDDDALGGITLPDGEDAFGFGAADSDAVFGGGPVGFDGQDEGFGANEDFEVYFKEPAAGIDPDEAEVEDTDLASMSRASKRRRTSEIGATSASLPEVDSELPPIETERNSFDGSQYGNDSVGELVEGVPSYDGSSRAPSRPQASSFDDQPFDEPFEDGFAGSSVADPFGMESVMADELPGRRSSTRVSSLRAASEKAGSEAAGSRAAPKPQAVKAGRPKRKMQIDAVTQLSTDEIRAALNDPSALVRDLAAEAAERAAAEGGAASLSAAARKRQKRDNNKYPIGAPTIGFLPVPASSLSIFQPYAHMQPAAQAPPARKAAVRRASAASEAAASTRASRHSLDDDAVEAWRSAQPASDAGDAAIDPSLGGAPAGDDALSAAAGRESVASRRPRQTFGEGGDGGFGFGEEEGFGHEMDEFDPLDIPFSNGGSSRVPSAASGLGGLGGFDGAGSEPPMADEEMRGEEEEADVEAEQAGEEEEVDAHASAGFDPSSQLPDVDGADAPDALLPKGGGGGGGGERGAVDDGVNADPSSWNSRTRKMYTMLRSAFVESSDSPLSYDAMIASTRSSVDKRKVVAGCFQELLFLTTHGIIELDQARAYGNILVSKTERFDGVAAH